MDYLINEGYPAAAQKFAREANIQPSADGQAIQQRVNIRNAIHTGDIQLAIERINELNPQASHVFPYLQCCPFAMINAFHAPLRDLRVMLINNPNTSVLSMSTITRYQIVKFSFDGLYLR